MNEMKFIISVHSQKFRNFPFIGSKILRILYSYLGKKFQKMYFRLNSKIIQIINNDSYDLCIGNQHF